MIEFTAAKLANSTAVVADVNALVPAQLGLKCLGYSVMESAGVPAAASLRIINGATAAGTAIVNQKLIASQSVTQWFGGNGIECPNGITVDFLAGQFDITIYYVVI